MSHALPPEIELQRGRLARDLGEEVTCDRLTKDFVMFQRRRGHRHSTDDLLTAWFGVAHLPVARPLRLLDLGSGIGSIGLAVLWCARAVDAGARLTAIEAQELSYRFLRENVAANGVLEAVQTIHGDLRDRSLLPGEARFDLITGSPPYFDVKAGIVSADSQRAHARFELRGDVRDYALAAARHLAPRGRFVLCFPTVQRRRAEEACEAAGLVKVEACDVVPKEGLPPLFSLFAYAHADHAPAAGERAPFVVRHPDGEHTDALRAAQELFGLRSGPPALRDR
jgi:tRNA1(Val) A37 N6-methylase TrmN6